MDLVEDDLTGVPESELTDEISPPFLKGIGVVFVEVEPRAPADELEAMSPEERAELERCDLCQFAAKNPPPPLKGMEQLIPHDNRWGVLYDTIEHVCYCREEQQSAQHAFHLRCLRSFVNERKSFYRSRPACPVCAGLIKKPRAEGMGEDDMEFSVEDRGSTGSKKQTLPKIPYQVQVHVVQAKGLKRPADDKPMDPVAYIKCFGQTQKTTIGDGGKTYSCVWNECFSFSENLDSEEFSKMKIEVSVEDYSKVGKNTVIGQVIFECETVRQANDNRELYKEWNPLQLVMKGKGKKGKIGLQGNIELSVCCFSEDDFKENPLLPVHIYDAEVQMWEELAAAGDNAPQDDVNDPAYLQKKMDALAAADALLNVQAMDVCTIKVYGAEDLVKLDSFGSNWVDAYVELDYAMPGAMERHRTPKIMKTPNPIWNHAFYIPMPHGKVNVERFNLVVKNYVTLFSDELIGVAKLNISDIKYCQANGGSFWKNMYLDEEGKAPAYTGRILIEVLFQENIPVDKAEFIGLQCAPLEDKLLPPAGTYKLEVDLYEGIQLLDEHSEYQVDITMGNTMRGIKKDREEDGERDKFGKVWLTVESDKKKKKTDTTTNFLTKRTILLPNMPYPRKPAPPPPPQLDKDGKPIPMLVKPKGAFNRKKIGIKMNDLGTPIGYTGDPGKLELTSDSDNFIKDTLPYINNKSLMPKGMTYEEFVARSQLPDLIIYVSKKGDRKECVGYLRIPMNGIKRPTESREHGEDLTLFPSIWNADTCDARCLPLKPLRETNEASTGFLLVRVNMSYANSADKVKASAPLKPVERQLYNFEAVVYQAINMAAVDKSGLSSPFCTIRVSDSVIMTKPKKNTTFPVWFEYLKGEVDLPANLLYAPDISVMCFHHKENAVLKWRDNTDSFMGGTQVAVSDIIKNGVKMSAPAWYPLQFEEKQFGYINMSFRITSVKAVGVPEFNERTLVKMRDGWEDYAIDIQALGLRGMLSNQFTKRKVDHTYEIEVWGDLQQFKHSEVAAATKTIILKKPDDDVFYSSLNFRVYDGKNLSAVASVPCLRLLQKGLGWIKILNLLMREPMWLSGWVWRTWKRFWLKKKIERRLANPAAAAAGLTERERMEDDAKLQMHLWTNVDEHDKLLQQGASRFGYLKAARNAEPVFEEKDDENTALLKGSSNSNYSGEPNEAPRQLDDQGNEIVDEKSKSLLVGTPAGKDPGDPFDKHWRIDADYELMPMTRDPFYEYALYAGKDKLGSSKLFEKLCGVSKKSVGKIRGHFRSYKWVKPPLDPLTNLPTKIKLPPNRIFEETMYQKVTGYTVRVTVMRGLGLVHKGPASTCDPFCQLHIEGAGEMQKSDVCEGTLNPKFYQCFEFRDVKMPSVSSILTITVMNDHPVMKPKLIGSTDVSLENRIFSKQWLAAQKPIERRGLRTEKTGLMPQGKIECCIQILTPTEEKEVAKMANDARNLYLYNYLLFPPKQIPWELRVIIWNGRKITAKNIACKTGCCCIDLCAGADTSDVKVCGVMMGSKKKPQYTDQHDNSLDGDAMWNWRLIFDVDLPSPEVLSNLKLQIWNINFSPDDCIAESVIPMWGFFEVARRKYEKNKEAPMKDRVTKIPRQWIHMKHPLNSDSGEIEIEIELVPKDWVELPEFKTAPGKEAFDVKKASPTALLPPPDRPETSFPFYRVDKAIKFRCCLCWKRLKPWLYFLLFLLICALIFVIWLHRHGYLPFPFPFNMLPF